MREYVCRLRFSEHYRHGDNLVQCLQASEPGHRYAQHSTKVINISISFSLLTYHPAGQVMLTVGTGERIRDIGDLKLLPLHSYAIIGTWNCI